ncbi:hypothetical protein RBB78_04300 [Tunturiibacter empetritectus]|uniref:hypothetical protein n=1 Tax=Tunturiibacter empetritectus TaxID=3069691 RepID=UPI003D9B1B68
MSSSLSPLFAQTSQPAANATTTPAINEPTHKEPTHADLLRGAYGPYRANNDLLFYRLDLRVDPEKVHQRHEHHPLQDGCRWHAHPA